MDNVFENIKYSFFDGITLASGIFSYHDFETLKSRKIFSTFFCQAKEVEGGVWENERYSVNASVVYNSPNLNGAFMWTQQVRNKLNEGKRKKCLKDMFPMNLSIQPLVGCNTNVTSQNVN